MIGIVDSGLGGIKTCFALREKHPETSFAVLADQKNAPYGEKDREELYEIARRNLAWFSERGIREVIVACNTMCSTVLEDLEKEFPHMKLWNIIDVTLQDLGHKRYSSAVVLATPATIRSGKYEKGLKKLFPERQVYPVASKKLVPLIEGGASSEEIEAVLHEYLDPYAGKADAVLLGCTHYPLVSREIRRVLPVKQYDPNRSIEKALDFPKEEHSRLEIHTTGNPETTRRQIRKLFGVTVEVQGI